MIIVAGWLRVDQQQRQEYLDACRPVIEAARRAPGCLDFYLTADPLEDDSPITRSERRAIAFFGIRGVGSIFYLAYVATHDPSGLVDDLCGVVAFTILLSIIVHGVTATGTMRRLDRLRHRRHRRIAALDHIGSTIATNAEHDR